MKSECTDGVKRLSYADRWWVLLFLAGVLAALAAGLWVYRDSSFYAKALGNRYVSDEIYYVDVARRILIEVFHVNGREWYSWSNKTGSDYFNPEHPPLGKYIIGVSMIVFGDRPYYWRLPGVIEASLTPLVLYLGYSLGRRDAWGVLAGIAAAGAAASSIALRAEAAVAMLDIHQAFFSALAVAALASGRLWLFMGLAGLAGSVKYSGLFIVPAIWLYLASCGECSRRRRAALFLGSIIVPPAVIVAVSAPLIAHFGIRWFWDNSVAGALAWHTSNRPPGPPTSSPMGWMFNVNPFYFDYDTLLGGLGNSILYIAAIIAGAGVIVYSTSRHAWPAAGAGAFYSALGLYLLLFNLGALHVPGLHGNKTLYSFYLVQLSPLAAATIGDAVAISEGVGRGMG